MCICDLPVLISVLILLFRHKSSRCGTPVRTRLLHFILDDDRLRRILVMIPEVFHAWTAAMRGGRVSRIKEPDRSPH